MTRLSQLLLPTERKPPADAEALSHRLMVRAGLIRQLGAGLWTWMPAGWRVHEKVTQIIREEIDAIGGQEMLMPVMQPRELWRTTGRDEIDELFKLKDRKGSEMVLAMTHEEAVTQHVAQVVRSYRDLPLILYHFQVKERDEPRPRAGVLRTREFIMKDSYSFDVDEEALDRAYEAHRVAYERIFARCGIDAFECASDVGMMGGSGAHEYMAPCEAGENDVALAPGYAANVEVASADPKPVAALSLTGDLHTPGLTTIEEVAAHAGVPAGNLLKAYPVVTDGGELVLVLLRGDHRVNDVKLRNHLRQGFRQAREDEIEAAQLVPGYIGPTPDVRMLVDEGAGSGPWIAGANRADYHAVTEASGLSSAERADIRMVEAGDTRSGTPIDVVRAIEVGNIFKLGTRYSEPLGARYLDAEGQELPIIMGCYGIGPARIVAAAVEQFGDEAGIGWPKAIAPWDVAVVGLGKQGSPERDAAEAAYGALREAGMDVLLDDRDAGPGEKLTDAELLGCPLRLTIGRRSLESGTAEAQARRGQRDLQPLPLARIAEEARARWDELP